MCMSAENVCTCVRASMSCRLCVHACIQQLLRACFCVYVFSIILAYVDVYVRVAAYGVHVCACVCVCACCCTCVCVCVPGAKKWFCYDADSRACSKRLLAFQRRLSACSCSHCLVSLRDQTKHGDGNETNP